MFFLLQHKQSSIFLSCFSKVQPANQVQVYYTVDQYIHTNPEHSAVDHLQEMDGAICLPRPHREEILPKLLFFYRRVSGLFQQKDLSVIMWLRGKLIMDACGDRLCISTTVTSC